ncbi:hypothetical protein CDD81_2846 [Ophiocordyceps australis]|uniref:1-phosphatidylinositol-4-phosphate 5-kinase n=1 Tax=Ophiocordyceps australis TaxID=1399860 RepID=A0A2C5XY82_9HYPO|nr:hypothetical protein CDD81_2846 [Ophiocordyceps australis]
MPSLLSDQSTPVFATTNIDLLHLDSKNHFGLAVGQQQANGAPLTRAPSGRTTDSFDQSSAASSHDSDASDAARMPANGIATRPTSMNSLTNGKGVLADSDAHDTPTPSKPFLDGPTVVPDRSVPRASHAKANGDLHQSSLPVQSLSPLETPRSISGTETTNSSPAMDSGPSKAPDEYGHDAEAVVSPVDAELSPGPQTAPLEDTSTNHKPVPSSSTPQRFSSPPTYPAGGVASGSSSANIAQAPPAGMTLKQRHTLEVPKMPSSRQSKDGADALFASGRFSPSVAGSIGNRRASLNLVRRTTRSMQSDAPRDELLIDEDALRWAEAYRQKRASKRRRKEEEDDDRVLVGTKVDESHANWVTAYNMLTGIRVSVSRTNAKLDRELTDADFDVKQKSTFDITGNELVPSAKYDFKFKDYAPWVFRHLRALFRLDPADYLVSLTGKYILSELGSPGKSGSFFYFSRDYKYIIKTIHHSEHKFLRKILKEYYVHVRENPNTLLSQFYGLHRVKMPYGKKIHFVVMNNLFPPHRDIHTTFDLKGSTIGRNYSEDDLFKNPRATLKDLNWLRRQQHLELGIKKKKLFLEQLQRDVILLKRLQIMDYSLLIGIHDLSRGNEENLRDKTLQVFNPGGEKPGDDDAQAIPRTPSKMENVRKARELRQMIRQERPVPIGQAMDKMADELGQGHSRPGFVFNQDDGGYRATHEDNSPADEIYYLGVIDCLTHYGMIKKIEHFWKGLSHDRTQISALPPDEYGDRFYNFVEGITMSAEEARREAHRRDQEAIEGQSSDYTPPRNSTPKSHHGIPLMPNHQAGPDGSLSPQGRETIEMASREARRTAVKGMSEKDVPDRTLRAGKMLDTRDSLQRDSILPIVEETGESNRNDAAENGGSFPIPPMPTDPPPPAPRKDNGQGKIQHLYGGYEGGSHRGVNRDSATSLQPRVSKESLNKDLPPLPRDTEAQESSVKMVA